MRNKKKVVAFIGLVFVLLAVFFTTRNLEFSDVFTYFSFLRLGKPAASAPTQTSSPSPAATPGHQASNEQHLAYLKENDLWIMNYPDGQSLQLTQNGDIKSFAWAPSGDSIVTYHGDKFCFYHAGSLSSCIDIDLPSGQGEFSSEIAWSPDQTRLVLWNTEDYGRQQEKIGWIIVDLQIDSPKILKIIDPYLWMDPNPNLASDFEDKGILGEPLFLADGTLIGSLTSRGMCGSGRCHYSLYEFDFQSQKFSPYLSNQLNGMAGGKNLALTRDGKHMANHATFHAGCASYTAYYERYTFETEKEVSYQFEQECIHEQALSPHGASAVLARGAACTINNEKLWAVDCGLEEAIEVYSMQLLDFDTNTRTDLIPGLFPDISPDGNYLSFLSCLAQASNNQWRTTSSPPPKIYVMDLSTPNRSITFIDVGKSPRWRP